MKSWEMGRDFKDLLQEDQDVMSYLAMQEIVSIFKIENFLGNLDLIFDRIFGER